LKLALATYQVLSDDFRHQLASIQAPTLAIWGSRDILTPPALGQVLASQIPQAKLAVMQGAGHNPMWDDPPGFARLVLGFLAAGDQTQSAQSTDPQVGRVSESQSNNDPAICAA
jgi:pimeloyl-ACP methyl ester carboxylesterase